MVRRKVYKRVFYCGYFSCGLHWNENYSVFIESHMGCYGECTWRVNQGICCIMISKLIRTS